MEALRKEGFEMPKAEIVIFDTEDVITTSSWTPDENEGPFVPAD